MRRYAARGEQGVWVAAASWCADTESEPFLAAFATNRDAADERIAAEVGKQAERAAKQSGKTSSQILDSICTESEWTSLRDFFDDYLKNTNRTYAETVLATLWRGGVFVERY